MPTRLLLGPQRPVIYLRDAIEAAGFPEGALAVVSAGWQEAEGDIDDIREATGRPVADLRLYHRAEQLFEADTGLRAAYRQRQDKLIELQRLYRLRLRQLMVAARNTLRAEGDVELLAAERRHAISQLRALDRHHLKRIRRINAEFDDAYSYRHYEPLADSAAHIASELEGHESVLITGGNVVVLMNRLQLFGLDALLADKHVIGWSAGAMTLCERIVLYHDRTPQGRRDPEFFGTGMGLVSGVIALPDPARRLREKDAVRLGLFSRRFGRRSCVTLDNQASLRFDGPKLVAANNVRCITGEGRLKKVRA